jgi:hypothetical protein
MLPDRPSVCERGRFLRQSGPASEPNAL